MKKSEEGKAQWGQYILMLTLTTLRCAIGYTLVVFTWGLGTEADASGWIIRKITGDATATGDPVLEITAGMLGCLIAFAPAILKIMGGNYFGVFQIPSYERITTYSDGSKSSDGGEQWAALSIFNIIIGATIGLVLAAIGTVVSVVAQWGFCIVMCFTGKKKAPIAVVAPIVLVFVAWFICAPLTSLQLHRFFNPQKYDTKPMIAAIADARNSLSANSYSYTVKVTHPKGYYGEYSKPPKEALRYNYEATVTYNKAQGNTVLEIKPLRENTYMEYFDKGKNKVLPGTYTFKNGIAVSTPEGSDRMSEAGFSDVQSLLAAETIAKMERLVISQSESEPATVLIKAFADAIAQIGKSVTDKSEREKLWGGVRVWEGDISNYSNPNRPDSARNRASREVSLYYHPWQHKWMHLNCYSIGGGKLRLYEFSGNTTSGIRFSSEEISYK